MFDYFLVHYSPWLVVVGLIPSVNYIIQLGVHVCFKPLVVGLFCSALAPGTNLLSGGLESVLVQWRYGQEGEKDFLPRLGSSIKEIVVSPDGSLFCTSHTDNSESPELDTVQPVQLMSSVGLNDYPVV